MERRLRYAQDLAGEEQMQPRASSNPWRVRHFLLLIGCDKSWLKQSGLSLRTNCLLSAEYTHCNRNCACDAHYEQRPSQHLSLFASEFIRKQQAGAESDCSARRSN